MTKKGPMNKISGWRERWFVLTPQKLFYYTHKDLKELKGEILMGANIKVEVGVSQSLNVPT